MGDAIPKSTVLRDALTSTKSMQDASKAILTLEEACEYLRISRWTLQRRIKSKELKTLTIGSRRLVRREALLDYIKQQEEK